MKIESSRQIFEESLRIKFYQNPSSGRRVTVCGRTDAQTEMTKLIVAFCNFTNATKIAEVNIWDG
jgi:hypothetical protein